MFDYLLAGALGGLVAFIFAVPAIVLEVIERGKVKNIPLVVDIKTIFGRKLKKEEVFFAAVLLHILVGTAYGVMYVLFVENDWLFLTGDPFSILSMILFAVGSFLVVGVLVFPLIGMGWFGRKEGRRVWMELLVSMLLIAGGVWLLVRYYQPQYF